MDNFFERVYKIVRTIPRGRVATYGQIARLAGKPHAARMVGWAMSSSSPKQPVPWHRVVGAGGRVVIAKAIQYSQIQKNLLQREGIKFRGECIIMSQFQWRRGLSPRELKRLDRLKC